MKQTWPVGCEIEHKFVMNKFIHKKMIKQFNNSLSEQSKVEVGFVFITLCQLNDEG